jgi:amino acid transporter
MLGVLALIATGLWHPARDLAEVLREPLIVDAAGNLVQVSMGALALGSIGAVYATLGGNQAIVFGEELHDPHKKMGRVILLAAAIGALATALPGDRGSIESNGFLSILGRNGYPAKTINTQGEPTCR